MASCRRLHSNYNIYRYVCTAPLSHTRILSDRIPPKFCIAHTAPSNLFCSEVCIRALAMQMSEDAKGEARMKSECNEEIIKSIGVTKCKHADDSGLRGADDRFYLNHIKSDTIVMIVVLISITVCRRSAVGGRRI